MMANALEQFHLPESCAVVIGGTGKIGTPMAEALAEAGARVYIASPSASNESRLVTTLRDAGLDAHGVPLDQSDERAVLDLIEGISNEFRPPDILVNCGVERPMGRYLDDSWQSWDRSMAVNARGLLVTCRAFAKKMADSGGGSIINVASIYGLIAPDPALYEGSAIGTEPDYPYTKGGMIMFSKYLASYYASASVRVNCIAPGGLFDNQPEPFYTRYIKKVPMGRMATADDLKGVTIFLSSPASSYITGAVIPVDGGISIR